MQRMEPLLRIAQHPQQNLQIVHPALFPNAKARMDVRNRFLTRHFSAFLSLWPLTIL
jgi:hypothetical protein